MTCHDWTMSCLDGIHSMTDASKSWISQVAPGCQDATGRPKYVLDILFEENTGWWYTYPYPSENYDIISWDYDIPNLWKVIPNMLQTTRNHMGIISLVFSKRKHQQRTTNSWVTSNSWEKNLWQIAALTFSSHMESGSKSLYKKTNGAPRGWPILSEKYGIRAIHSDF